MNKNKNNKDLGMFVVSLEALKWNEEIKQKKILKEKKRLNEKYENMSFEETWQHFLCLIAQTDQKYISNADELLDGRYIKQTIVEMNAHLEAIVIVNKSYQEQLNAWYDEELNNRKVNK
jgi:hypothetical protein